MADAAAKPLLNMTGDRVALGPLTREILLVVHAMNEAGVKAYTRAGFQVIGRRREMICRDGRRYDLIYMDCTASDFFAGL